MLLSITADQMSAAAGYLVANWGDYGYRFEAVEPTSSHAVTVFRVACSDGSRFVILADKWGNCRDLDTHGGDGGLAGLVRVMHAAAIAT